MSAQPHGVFDAPLVRTRGSRHWGWVLADGLLGVVVGVIALAWPAVTVLALALLIGFGLLVQGAFQFSAGLRAATGTPGRGWVLFFGALAIVAGLICLFHPGAGIFAIVLGVAIWFFSAGVNELVAAATLSEHRLWNGVIGALSIVAGIISVAAPGVALSTAALLVGVLFVIRGAGEIGLARQLRRLPR